MSAASQRKMKPSGVDWIGDVPEGWSVRRIKYLVGGEGTVFMDGDWINSDIIVDDGVRYLTSGNVGVGVFKRQGNGHITNETFKELNCLKALPGDLMLCRLNEPLGRGCIIPDDEPYYVIAVDNVILRPEKEYDKRYIMHCVSCDLFSMAALIAASGATMQRISRNDLGRLLIPIPPLDEQKRIAAKLDRLCGRVDELAENIKGEIAALQEYRKSLITECVTKGLNPKAKMKPSGVDWIGDVPEGWTVASLKYLFSLSRGVDLTQDEFIDGNIPVCGSNGVMGYHNKATQHGPVVTIGRSGSVGKINYFEQDCWVHNTAISVVDARANNLRYIYYCLLSFDVSDLATKTAVPTLDRKNVENYKWVYTQDVAEQSEIAAFLDKRCAVIDAKIAERQRQLEKLGEYRSSVIYEYVTGKRETAVDESSDE